MLKLIIIELKKVFHKKNIYIIYIIMFSFCLLNNILYKTDYDKFGNYKYLNQDKLLNEEKKLQEELKKYDKNNINEISIYTTIKTRLEIIKLKKSYPESSWQYNKTEDYLYDTLYQLNTYKYKNESNELYNEINKEYQLILNKLNNNEWTFFKEKEKSILEENIYNLKEQLLLTKDKKEQLKIKSQLEEQELNLKILKYRIKNNIKEDNNFLNVALENYKDNYQKVEYYEKLDMINNHQEKIIYQISLNNLKNNEYILKNKQNINKQNNLNYQLRTIIDDYEILFVILILIVSGTIICDEFRDGTIKLLLIKPYSRGKILLSKYFSVIIVLGISLLSLIIFQTIVGGIIFGLDSLKMPIIVYDFNKLKIVEYSVIEYMIIRIIFKLPFFIILIGITVLIGIISNNSIISIILPLTLYMFAPIMKDITIKYNLTFMKYFVNINWNLEDYLFGNLSEISFLTIKWSVSILIIYFVIMIIITFKIFQKKNIKNI